MQRSQASMGSLSMHGLLLQATAHAAVQSAQNVPDGLDLQSLATYATMTLKSLQTWTLPVR